jgi:hypothetical protein
MAEMKKFSRETELAWIEFEIDGEVFRAANVAPAMAIFDVAMVNQAEGTERLRLISSFLDQILEPASGVRFSERMRSVDNPITIDEVTKVAVWLVEEVYATERPTEAPSPSPNGSGSTGPSTTDTASTTASTPESSTRRVL